MVPMDREQIKKFIKNKSSTTFLETAERIRQASQLRNHGKNVSKLLNESESRQLMTYGQIRLSNI